MTGGAWRRLAACAALAIYAATALPGAVARATTSLGLAWTRRSESLTEARTRVFGAEYVDGIDRARAAIPLAGSYALFDAGRVEDGAANWVRYDLAPRRAVSGGRISKLGRPEKVRQKLSGLPPTLVVARPGRAPLVLDREEFLARLAEDRLE